MYPGTVTRVIMKCDLGPIVDKNLNPVNSDEIPGVRPAIKNGQPPESPRTGGHEFVWHCHILEHEEHDMMHSAGGVADAIGGGMKEGRIGVRDRCTPTDERRDIETPRPAKAGLS